MSDVQDNDYKSEIDPLFSQAWNEIFSEEKTETTPKSGEEAGVVEPGTETSTTPDEGAPAGSGTVEPPTNRDESETSPTPTEGGTEGGTDGSTNETGPATPPVVPKPEINHSEIFGKANETISTRMTNAMRAQATEEVRAEIDEKFLNALNMYPLELVGQEVPSLNRNAGPNDKMRILDTAMAKEWQETVEKIIQRDIEDNVKQRSEEIRPMMSIIQESVLLFQNNPDITPGSSSFNHELASRFAKMVAPYEVKMNNGRRIGYAVNVQPLLNDLRESMKANTPAAPKKDVSQQPRAEDGKFTGPQPGLLSSAVQQSDGEEEDFSAFWKATGIKRNDLRI